MNIFVYSKVGCYVTSKHLIPNYEDHNDGDDDFDQTGNNIVHSSLVRVISKEKTVDAKTCLIVTAYIICVWAN